MNVFLNVNLNVIPKVILNVMLNAEINGTWLAQASVTGQLLTGSESLKVMAQHSDHLI